MDESELVESSSEGEREGSPRTAEVCGRLSARTSPQQFLVMMAFMEEHGDLTKKSWSSLECVEKWEQLRRALDAVGDKTRPPRPLSKWKKVWADLKNNTKRKALQKTRAGAGPLRLTHLEFRLLKLMGLIKTKSSAPPPAPAPVLLPVPKQPPEEAADEAAAPDAEIITLDVGACARPLRPVPLLELQLPAGAGAWLDAPHRSMDDMEEGAEECAEFADCSAPSPAPAASPAAAPAPAPGPAPRPDPWGHTSVPGLMSSMCIAEQFAAMLEFLQARGELARGELRGREARALWGQLAQRLNAMGGGVKTVQQWQKVWADRKHAVKKNAAALRRAGAGAGEPAAWELRLLDILGGGSGGLDASALGPLSPPPNVKEEEAEAPRLQCEDPLAPRRGDPGAAWEGQGPGAQLPPRRRRGWRRGAGALALLARALARGEARQAELLRLRRDELRLQRGWQRMARRGLRLMERFLQREPDAEERWATVLVPRARPLVLHPDRAAWPE